MLCEVLTTKILEPSTKYLIFSECRYLF